MYELHVLKLGCFHGWSIVNEWQYSVYVQSVDRVESNRLVARLRQCSILQAGLERRDFMSANLISNDTRRSRCLQVFEALASLLYTLNVCLYRIVLSRQHRGVRNSRRGSSRSCLGAVRVGEGVVEASWGAVRVAEEGEARTGSREPVLAVAAMEEGILAKAVEGSFPNAIVNAKSE
jgi:hypothetical protein